MDCYHQIKQGRRMYPIDIMNRIEQTFVNLNLVKGLRRNQVVLATEKGRVTTRMRNKTLQLVSELYPKRQGLVEDGVKAVFLSQSSYLQVWQYRPPLYQRARSSSRCGRPPMRGQGGLVRSIWKNSVLPCSCPTDLHYGKNVYVLS